MGRKNSSVHYYSDELLEKLEKIVEEKTTLIEAPTGYGKTTAIKDLMQNAQNRGATVEWITVAEEPVGAFCNRFFTALNRIDNKIEEISDTEDPFHHCPGKVIDMLAGMTCEKETFLIIDNLDLIQGKIPEEIFRSLIGHGGEGLHIILITRTIYHAYAAILGNADIYTLRTKDFCFTTEDIFQFYKVNSMPVSMHQAIEIANYTQGWAVAVYLQFLANKRTGEFKNFGAAILLMENQVWDRLNEDEKDILLSFSKFDVISLKLAVFMTRNRLQVDEIRTFLEKIPFITRIDGGRKYEVHKILRDVLEEKLSEKEIAYQRNLEIRRADWYLELGEIEEALWIYYVNQAYSRILLIDLSGFVFRKIKGVSVLQIAQEVAMNYSPADAKTSIIPLLKIARILCFMGNKPLYRSLMEQIRRLIDKLDYSEKNKNQLKGEWHLIYALTHLPKLDCMLKEYQEAEKLMNGHSKVVSSMDSFLMGGPIQILDLHSSAGRVESMIDTAESCITLYSKLTDGGGRGMDILLKAELALMRGDFDEASILAYKAAFMAESSQQSGIVWNAELIVLITMLCTGNEEGFRKAYDRLGKVKENASGSQDIQYSAEVIEGWLLLCLGRSGLSHQSSQLNFAELSIKKNEPEEGADIVPVTYQTLHHVREFIGMYYRKEYWKLIGSAQADATQAEENGQIILSIMLHCILSAAYCQIHDETHAGKLLEKALKVAVIENIILPFVCMWDGIQTTVKSAEFLENGSRYAEFIDLAEVMATTVRRGRKRIQKEEHQQSVRDILAKRELEIAQLAAKGDSNQKIAEELYLSVNTVKMHLKNIFRKLEIEKRSELVNFFHN